MERSCRENAVDLSTPLSAGHLWSRLAQVCLIWTNFITALWVTASDHMVFCHTHTHIHAYMHALTLAAGGTVCGRRCVRRFCLFSRAVGGDCRYLVLVFFSLSDIAHHWYGLTWVPHSSHSSDKKKQKTGWTVVDIDNTSELYFPLMSWFFFFFFLFFFSKLWINTVWETRCLQHAHSFTPSAAASHCVSKCELAHVTPRPMNIRSHSWLNMQRLL